MTGIVGDDFMRIADPFERRRAVQESMRRKAASLPRVDHNGVPYPDDAPNEPEPTVDPELAGAAPPARPGVPAPIGPRGTTPEEARRQEPLTGAEQFRALAIQQTTGIAYHDALDQVRGERA